MKDRHHVLIVVALAVALTSSTASAQDGRALFDGICKACHTIGGGTLVGPDLAGITERRSEEWLIPFIQSTETVIASGDETAVALFAEFNQLPMPDVPYSADEVRAVLAYIETGGAGTGVSFPDRPATPEEIEWGRGLFQGTTRLINHGPACNSCHHVRNDAVIGGGVLAKELTTVFSRMGRNGVGSILGSAPFPVMEAAYADRPVTDEEAFAIVAFLEEADAQQAFQQPADYGVKLLQGGFGGFAVLMVLYGVLWRRRKQRSVNQGIYDRQVKSQ